MYEIVWHMQQIVSDMGHLVIMGGDPEQFEKAVDIYQMWLKQLPSDGFNQKEANERIEKYKSSLKEIQNRLEKNLREAWVIAGKRENVEDMPTDVDGAFKLYGKRLNDFLSEKWNNIYEYCGNLTIKLTEKYGK